MNRRRSHRSHLFIIPLLFVGCLTFFGAVKLFRAKAPVVEAQAKASAVASTNDLFEQAKLLAVDETGELTDRATGVATRLSTGEVVNETICQIRASLPAIERTNTQYVAWMVQDEPFALSSLSGELVPFEGEWFLRTTCKRGTHIAITRQSRDEDEMAPSQRLVFGTFAASSPDHLPEFPAWEMVAATQLVPTPSPQEGSILEDVSVTSPAAVR